MGEMTTLDDPPMYESIAAMTKLKRGKASGKSGILPELLICGGPELTQRLLCLMTEIWHAGEVVKDWMDAEIVPIPKKGDLRYCDNWRGISLLDVIGKLLGRMSTYSYYLCYLHNVWCAQYCRVLLSGWLVPCNVRSWYYAVLTHCVTSRVLLCFCLSCFAVPMCLVI